jgi:RNA polymerase sigma-70 factor (ECF subfamily)
MLSRYLRITPHQVGRTRQHSPYRCATQQKVAGNLCHFLGNMASVRVYNAGPMKSAPDNRRLAKEAHNGSRDAFREIYECYSSRIYNFLCRLLGSRQDAEDATQQTFLIALNRIETLRDPDLMEPWLYRIARNEVYQKFRRKQVDSLDDDMPSPLGDRIEDGGLHGHPEKALLNDELGEAIQSVLDSLPLKLREVFILAIMNELSYQDISTIVGRSLLSVKTDIYRARLMAKEKLSRYTILSRRTANRENKA